MAKRVVTPVDPDLLAALGQEASWSDAVSIGDFVWVCGQIGWDKKTGKFVEGIEAQTERTFENLKSVLEKTGSSLDNIIMLHAYLTWPEDFEAFDRVYARFFPKDPPARTVVFVKALIDHDVCVLDIECVALKKSTG